MDEKKSVMGEVRSLKLGETKSFPIEKLFTIRTLVSNLNSQRATKSLRTSTNRETKTITVQRIA